MAEHVEVIGADRLASTSQQAMNQLGDMSLINGTVARYVASRAATYAPKLTGRLAYSIRGEGEKQAVTVSTSVPYAAVQEFGWPGHNIVGHRYMGRASKEGQAVAIQAQARNLDRVVSTIKGA